MFRAQRAAIPSLLVPEWPPSHADDSLASFAARLAAAIPVSDALYLGGCSFGGMVALELAALVKPKGVILIGSCRGPESLSPVLRHLRGPVRALPASVFRPRRWSIPLVRPFIAPLNGDQERLFVEMAAAARPGFLKWGAEAILSWRPSPVTAPVHQIHGANDRVVPLRLVVADVIVPEAGHLLTLTHPAEVNAFLRAVTDGT
jgi:pimeloyl-ACP methyl ester carboxylesterase